MFMGNVTSKMMSTNNNVSMFQHWSLEDGYAEGFDDNSTAGVFVYPYRVLNSGSKAGLKVGLAINTSDMDYACRGPVQGFKIVFHTPNELPLVEGQFFRIPTGQDIRVSIKPNVLRTKKSLTGLSPNRSLFDFTKQEREFLKIFFNFLHGTGDNAFSTLNASYATCERIHNEIAN